MKEKGLKVIVLIFNMARMTTEQNEDYVKIGYVMIDRIARTPDEIKSGGAGVPKNRILKLMPLCVENKHYSFNEETGKYRIERPGIDLFERLKRRLDSVAPGRLIR